MTELPFTQYQLFHGKRSTLEEQIVHYYQETQDSATTIQLLLAMKIRHMLGEADFELFLPELVRHLFVQQQNLRAMRRYFHYFRDYFQAEEWQLLSARYFPTVPVSTSPVEEKN